MSGESNIQEERLLSNRQLCSPVEARSCKETAQPTSRGIQLHSQVSRQGLPLGHNHLSEVSRARKTPTTQHRSGFLRTLTNLGEIRFLRTQEMYTEPISIGGKESWNRKEHSSLSAQKCCWREAVQSLSQCC